jgi:hypothetical protein
VWTVAPGLACAAVVGLSLVAVTVSHGNLHLPLFSRWFFYACWRPWHWVEYQVFGGWVFYTPDAHGVTHAPHWVQWTGFFVWPVVVACVVGAGVGWLVRRVSAYGSK